MTIPAEPARLQSWASRQVAGRELGEQWPRFAVIDEVQRRLRRQDRGTGAEVSAGGTGRRLSAGTGEACDEGNRNGAKTWHKVAPPPAPEPPPAAEPAKSA